MKLLKKAWLEIIFGLLTFVILILSVGNLVPEMKIHYSKSLPQSDIELSNVSMDEYLKEIQNLDNCTAIMVVKDIQGFSITQQITDELKAMGFKNSDILLNKEPHSFIGIYSSGKVLYQEIGGDSDISWRKYLNNHDVYARSATVKFGNSGDIYIDGVPYSANSRGFNIVVIDNTTDSFIDSVAYDTHMKEIPFYRLIDGKTTYITSTNER